jgi:hypothetical protein
MPDATPILSADAEKQILAAASSGFTQVMNAPADQEPAWAKPAIAILAMLLLVGVIVYSVVAKDHDAMMLCIGSVISMATGAGNYYLGSSSGSARKTDLLAASPAIAVPPAA